jgi:proline-specific peptidase
MAQREAQSPDGNGPSGRRPSTGLRRDGAHDLPVTTRGLAFAFMALATTTCATADKPNPRLIPGEYRLAVPGGNIWYKVTGTGKGTPVILLHGGPGFSSFYLKSLEDLGDDRVVIRYDQLGGGKSDRISDTTMFTFSHFVTELDSLRAYLGLEKVHVLGHSWGTMLGVEYYRAHPTHVASLTFGSAVFDVPAYAGHARELLKTLPDSSQRAIAEAEATGQFESPAYQAAISEFYGRYLWRHPVQADLDSTFATVNQAIYMYMQGPSEFTITGTFKDYNVTSFLPQITVPTLFAVGEFDEVGPELVKSFADRVPGARYVVMPGAAHITTWDAADAMNTAVRSFLRSADSTVSR